MATGLDAAASITALISMSVVVFKGCIEGYQMISAARHAGEEMIKVRCLIEWQEYRFVQWAKMIGLSNEDALPNLYLPWKLIHDTLDHLERIFTDTDRLRDRYGLIEDRSTPVKEARRSDKEEESGITKLWAYVGSEVNFIRARTAKGFEKAKRLRWVAVDQTKMRLLITDLNEFNDHLVGVISEQDRIFVRTALSALLQDLVARTNRSSDLDILKVLSDSSNDDKVKAIEAAADIKQVRMYLKLDHRPKEQPSALSSKPKVTKVEYSKLKFLTDGGDRQIAVYKSSKRQVNSVVLLNWKRVPKDIEKQMKPRIVGLTLLLSRVADPSFNILPCLGYTEYKNENESYSSYAYAFELYPLRNDNADVSTKNLTTSLGSYIERQGKQTSLSKRVEYARRVAQAVLQLHTSGWMHKTLCSHNLVFVQKPDSLEMQGPYLIDFSYARADNPLELTEDPTGTKKSNIYTHPELLKPIRPPYCKMFDLYSLGCVLAEIAMWKPLEEAISGETAECNSSVLSRAETITSLVAFHAGDTFAKAVSLCFHPKGPELGAEDNATEEDHDLESSVHNQLEVLRLLNTCQY